MHNGLWHFLALSMSFCNEFQLEKWFDDQGENGGVVVQAW